MKKITIILAILAMLLLTSCLPETPPPPYGVWRSENPQITLFFTPEYQIIEGRQFYFGIYTVDSVDTKLAIEIFPGGRAFAMYDLSEPRGRGGGVRHSGTLFSGTYRLVRGEIRHRTSPAVQERLGIDIIIFQRAEYYVPLDPEWIANFVPIPE